MKSPQDSAGHGFLMSYWMLHPKNVTSKGTKVLGGVASEPSPTAVVPLPLSLGPSLVSVVLCSIVLEHFPRLLQDSLFLRVFSVQTKMRSQLQACKTGGLGPLLACSVSSPRGRVLVGSEARAEEWGDKDRACVAHLPGWRCIHY